MQAETTDVDTPEGDSIAETPLTSLRDLMEAPEGDSNTGEGAGNGDDTQPAQFNDLAEAVSMELDDLYALEVSTNGGDKVTVQDLKNFYDTQETFTVKELEWEEQRVEQQAGLRQAQNELAAIIQSLPAGTVNAELLEGIRGREAERVQAEQAKTLSVIPEWQNADTRKSDMQGMAAQLKTYGLPAETLAQITDHRMLQYIRDNWQREQRIKLAMSRVKAGTPPKTSKPSPAVAKKQPPSTPASTAVNGLQAYFEDID